MTIQICTGPCKRALDHTEENFHLQRHAGKPDKLRVRCKQCRGLSVRTWQAENATGYREYQKNWIKEDKAADPEKWSLREHEHFPTRSIHIFWPRSVMRVLFILKKNNYGYEGVGDGAGGLLNSCRFIVDMLRHEGIHAKIAVVVDNNDIDREVDQYQPDVVIIEALWVVPEKFDILSFLHPDVTWIVRLHSDLPFLASDGIAFQWIFDYLSRRVYVALNKNSTARDIQRLTDSRHVLYLPNYYKIEHVCFGAFDDDNLHIGCFGAVRPLKNQLIQAAAAIEYADMNERRLSFHMNGTRLEQGGVGALKNIKALFANTGHELVLHPWLPHHEFLKLMSKMDLSMAVSFSETFCITAADAVAVNVPLVCSDQVPWADRRSIVTTTETKVIREKIADLLSGSFFANFFNHLNLKRYAKKSKRIWLDTLDRFANIM